jgi:uncharacterized protein (TIGR03435 family)
MQIAKLAVIMLVMTSSSASSQTLTFEAASVKPNTSGDFRIRGGTRGRTYNAVNMPLRRIVATAYDLQLEEFRLVGNQPLLAERFDITATIPESASPRQVPVMLRALLTDRFKLAVHTETRDVTVLALTLERRDGRLGPNLRRAAIDCAAAEAAGRAIPAPEAESICQSEISDSIKGRGLPLNALARMLTVFMQRTVRDDTGLSGGFDFDLKFDRAAAGPGVDTSSALVTALEDQLGLKLQSARAPLEFVVIDAIERPASN